MLFRSGFHALADGFFHVFGGAVLGVEVFYGCLLYTSQKSESSDASDTRREFLVEKEEETEEEEEPSVSQVTEELDDSCFTETLDKIYIKQHRYDKALEIIKKLCLNYPKKNAYFVD